MKFTKVVAIAIFVMIISTFILGGCAKKEEKLLSTAISQIDLKANGHIEQLHEYDSPYTVCYKNDDETYSMYIFASPIQFKAESGYAIIDNTVIESTKEGVAFENKANEIKTYFPNRLSELFRIEKGTDFLEFKPNFDVNGFSEAKQGMFINMYGDKISAVLYERSDMDIVFYPTKAGIKSEIVLKHKPENESLIFAVQNGGLTYENKQNGYILFKNGGDNKSIIYQPLIQFGNGSEQHFNVSAQLDVDKADGGDYTITISIPQSILNDNKTKYPVKLDPSFEMYVNKMPDTSVYSKSNINSYLRHYAVIGQHPVLGQGWEYVRFRTLHFLSVEEKSVLEADYLMKQLNLVKNNVPISMNRALMQWSSTGILWSDRIDGTESVANNINLNGGNLEFDITEYVREILGVYSWESESIGVVLKHHEESESYSIVSTSDNSLYTSCVRIKLSKLPMGFTPKDNINDVGELR